MTRRTLARALFASMLIASAATAGDASEIVEIVLHGRYFTEPATVRFMVAVEPNDENRMLRIEADSAEMFWASEMALNGAGEKRLHTITFKNLTAGHYMLRAQVRSANNVRGTATHEVVVTGAGLR